MLQVLSFFNKIIPLLFFVPLALTFSEIGNIDLYPSYKCYIGSTCYKNCTTQNCNLCEIETICTQCFYGYFLNTNNSECYLCPENCSNCLNGIELEWHPLSKLCEETNKYYYENHTQKTFFECSANCSYCENDHKCKFCVSGFYLKYNDYGNYSCEKCDENCNFCHFGNETYRSNFEIYEKFPLLSDFQNNVLINNWTSICDGCISGYFLNINKGKTCEKCSDYIKDCETCFFNSLNGRIPECNSCTNSKYLNALANICQYCSDSNCLVCDIIVFLEISLSVEKCLLCADYYFLYKDGCSPCPENCLSCFSSNKCKKCDEQTYLSLPDFTCKKNDSLVSKYVNQGCASIIAYNGAPYCQSCINELEIPTLTNNCRPCPMNCKLCNEYFNITSSTKEYFENLDSLITDFEKLTANPGLFQIVCDTCDDNYGKSPNKQFCCPPCSALFPGLAAEIILDCIKCSSCHSELQICVSCAECRPISSEEMKDTNIVNADFKSTLYQKKIFYLMWKNGLYIETSPAITQREEGFYRSVYRSLNVIYRKDIAAKYIYKCSECSITSGTQCGFSNFNSSDLKYYVTNDKELAYLASDEGCLPGFFPKIKGNKKVRCRLCPMNWNSCKTYKEINITFCDNCGRQAKFLVNNITELNDLFSTLENNELSIILNVLDVEELTINILLQPNSSSNSDFLFNNEAFRVEFTSTFLKRIPGLVKYTMNFLPFNYDLASFIKIDVSLACSFVFSGFTNVNFININFKLFYLTYTIQPSNLVDAFSVSPGILIENSENVLFSGCSFTQRERSTLCLVDGNFVNSGYKCLTPSMNSLFLIHINATKVVFEDFSLYNISFGYYDYSYSPLQQANIFEIYASNEVIFQNFRVSYINLVNRGFMKVMNAVYGFYLKNFFIVYFTWNSNTFEFITSNAMSVYCEYFIVLNSKFKAANAIFLVSTPGTLDLKQTYIENSEFECSDINKKCNVFKNNLYNILDFRLFQCKLYYTKILTTLMSSDENNIYYLNFASIVISYCTLTEQTQFYLNLGSSNKYYVNVLEVSILECNRNFSLTNFSDIFSIDNAFSLVITKFTMMNSPLLSGISLYSIKSAHIEDLVIKSEFIEQSDIYDHYSVYINPIPYDFKLINLTVDNMISRYGFIVLETLINSDIKQDMQFYLYCTNIFVSNTTIYAKNLEFSSFFTLYGNQPFKFSIENGTFLSNTIHDSSIKKLSTSLISIASRVSEINLIGLKFLNSSSFSKSSLFYISAKQINIFFCSFYKINFLDLIGDNVLMTNTFGGIGNFRVQFILLSNITMEKCYGLAGGAFFVSLSSSSFVLVEKSYFNQVLAISFAGIFYFITSNTENTLIHMAENNFINLGAAFEGGIIYMKYIILGAILIKKCNFIGLNSFKTSFIYAKNVYLDIANTTFSTTQNLLSEKIYPFSNENAVNIDDGITSSSFLYLESSTLNLNNVNFTDIWPRENISIVLPVFSFSYCQIQIRNTVFSNSHYISSFFSLETSSIQIHESTFFNCSSIWGNYTEFNATSFMYLLKNSFILLNHSEINMINCHNCRNGGNFLTILDSSTLSCLNSNFHNNSGVSGTCIFRHQENLDSEQRNLIKDSIFHNNSAIESGGCLTLISSNFTLINVSFDNCYSGNRGGAIYTKGNSYSILINESKFTNNRALIGGAIYYNLDEILLIKENCFFENNTATYFGMNLFSNPKRLRIIVPENNSYYFYEDEFYIDNFRSGATLPTLTVEILDEENNPISYISTIFMPSLEINTQTDLIDTAITINEKKTIIINYDNSSTFKISNIKLAAPPNSTAILYLTSSNIKNQSFPNYSFRIIINLRQCIIGELKIYTICLPCKGKYSFDINDSLCKKCLVGLLCDEFGVTSVQPGYWRDQLYTENIIKCEKNLDYCVGGSGFGNQLCKIGHIGPRCESCDLMSIYWNESYTQTSLYNCQNCNEGNINYLILGFLTIMIFIWMAVSVYSTMQNIKTNYIRRFIKYLSYYSMIPEKKNEISVYIKIYFSYFQTIQIIWGLNWLYVPENFKFFTVALAHPLQIIVNSTECMIPYLNSSIPYVFIKLIIMIIAPFVYLEIFLLIGWLILFKQDKRKKKSMKYIAFSFCFLFFQPSAIKSIIDVLTCIQINEKTYMKSNLAFSCEDPSYKFYALGVAMPGLLLWSVIIPGYLFISLFRIREKLNDIANIRKYGYLYHEYNFFFWEFIRMNEKNLIIIFLEFYETEEIFKSLLILIVLAVYFMLIVKFKPYKLKKLNELEKRTIMVCFSSLFFGILTVTYEEFYVLYFSYFLVMIINIIYNAYFTKKIIEIYITSRNFKYLFEFRCINWIMRFFPEKKYRTIKLWHGVRRLVARYLREKYRRSLIADINLVESSYFKLTLPNYEPFYNEKMRELIRKEKEQQLKFKDFIKNSNILSSEELKKLEDQEVSQIKTPNRVMLDEVLQDIAEKTRINFE